MLYISTIGFSNKNIVNIKGNYSIRQGILKKLYLILIDYSFKIF